MDTDWFEQITGFKERSYEETKSNLAVEGQTLILGAPAFDPLAADERALDGGRLTIQVEARRPTFTRGTSA